MTFTTTVSETTAEPDIANVSQTQQVKAEIFCCTALFPAGRVVMPTIALNQR
jgi:hypothetical protein